ncbi:MAG: DUF4105 domain-containing protein [Bacteroidales bacterium]
MRLRLQNILLILLTGSLLSLASPLHASEYENSKISLLTCTGGSELYSTFGHSALRVQDDSLSIDIVFNFGLFDFNTPNFYMKFLRGRLNYMLGIQTTSEFLWQYNYEGRGVIEQKLDLTPFQKREIMERLNFLYRPENRYYLYSFLHKNCTTELRDLLKPYISFSEGKESTTFRELIYGYVVDSKWTRTGINLILGSNLDKEISIWEGMFLPDKLYEGLKPFSNERELLPRGAQSFMKKTPFILSPLFFSLIILLGLVLSRFFKAFRPLQLLVLIISALLGLVLPLIILLTDHVELHANYNLLWCNPLYIILLGVYPFAAKIKKAFRIMTVVMMIFSLTAVIIWLNKVQGFLPEYVFILASQVIMLGGIRTKVYEEGN